MWQERHLINPNVTGGWDLVALAFFQSSYQRTFHSSVEIGDTAGLKMGPTLGLTPGSPGTQGPNCLAEVNQWGEGRSPNLSLNTVFPRCSFGTQHEYTGSKSSNSAFWPWHARRTTPAWRPGS